jgi:hypothetical protein
VRLTAVAPPPSTAIRHLLQVLAIKLRQMEGATLDTLSAEVCGHDR